MLTVPFNHFALDGACFGRISVVSDAVEKS